MGLDPGAATFDPLPFRTHLERARTAGTLVQPLSAFPWQEEMAQRRLYALMVEVLADVPTAIPFEPWPVNLWRERVLHDPQFDPRASTWRPGAASGSG